MESNLTIKKFFAFSILAHAIILFGIYFIPVAKEKQPGEFFTTLISPEELLKPEKRSPQEKIQPAAPAPPPALKKAPLPRVARIRPSPEKPVVPGEGDDTGRPQIEGLDPETGNKDKIEDASDISNSLKPEHYGREKLFDKGIIGDIAKRDIEKFQKEAKRDNSITFDTREYRYAGYMTKLKERIESIWVYPPEARLRGIYGDLKIRFTIKKNGRLGAIELVRTSGYKMLDDAAMRALKNGEPYWPLPDEWGMESYTISGHFIYNIYGYHVR